MAEPAVASPTISFFVHGIPIPQGSTRAFVPNGHTRPIITNKSRGLEQWRRLISDVAQRYAHRFDPADVTIRFYFPKPKSAPKRRPVAMRTKPDLDKLLRAALDAMTGIMYDDDARVVRAQVVKLYAGEGNPVGAHIVVCDGAAWAR